MKSDHLETQKIMIECLDRLTGGQWRVICIGGKYDVL